MDCPKCKLVNPANAQRCDCGYDFTTQRMESSYLNAKDQTMSGIRGWLAILAFSLVLAPFRLLRGALLPDSPSYARTVDVTLTAAAIFLCILFFRQKKSFPLAFIVVLTFRLVLAAIGFGVRYFEIEPDVFGTLRPGFQYVLIGQLLVVIVWVPYLLLSRRVKATFIR